MTKNYCEECGEVTGECICHLITYVEYEEKDFVWEYAHELVSVRATYFKKNMPIID